MKRILSAALLATAAGLACCSLVASAAPPNRPSLRVTLEPLVIRGTNFRARETVILTFTAGSVRRARGAMTTVRGTFVARFAGVDFDRCSTGFSVVAVGRSGDRASYKRPQMLCAP